MVRPYGAWSAPTVHGPPLRCMVRPYGAWSAPTVHGPPLRCMVRPYGARNIFSTATNCKC